MSEKVNEGGGNEVIVSQDDIDKGGGVRSIPSIPAPPLDPLGTALLRAIADPDFPLERVAAANTILREREADQRARAAEQAERDFDDALARAQANFPIIPENGRLKIYPKALRERAARDGEHVYIGQRPQQNTPYALWEDVLDGIMPALTKEGLSLTFAVDTPSTAADPRDGKSSFKIIVKGFLRRQGVTRQAETPPLEHDASGSKNAIQAIKSTTSYGKSMVTGFLVNFGSRGENDDGQGGATPAGEDTAWHPSPDDLKLINDGLEATNTKLEDFLDTIQAPSIEDMNETQLGIGKAMLLRKHKMMEQRAAAKAKGEPKAG